METASESITNRLIESEVSSKTSKMPQSLSRETESEKVEVDVAEKLVSVAEESNTNGHRGSVTLERISEVSESTQESTTPSVEESGSLLMRQTKRIVSQEFGEIGSETDSQSRRASEIEKSLSDDVFGLESFEATQSKTTTVTKTERKGSVTETKVISNESTTTQKSIQSGMKTEVRESVVETKFASSESASKKSERSQEDEVDSKKIQPKENVDEEEKMEGVAPVLEMVSAPVNLQEGMDLKLQFKLQGDPKPKVTWSKDGDSLKVDNKRIIMVWSGDLITLEVKKLTASDAGVYAVHAVNISGESLITVTISIAERSETSDRKQDGSGSPKFTVKPQGLLVVEEFEKMKLEVSISGVQYDTADEDSPDSKTDQEKIQGKLVAGDAEVANDVTDSSRDLLAKSEVSTDSSRVKVKDEAEVSVSMGEKTDETGKKDDTDKESEKSVSDRRRRSETAPESSSDVCFVPTDLLKKVEDEELPDAKREEETDEESSVQKKRRLTQSPKSGSMDVDIDTSEDEFGLLLSHPDYVAIADYTPSQQAIDSATREGVLPPLRMSEGQVVEVLDMQRSDLWLVQARPTKTSAARQGWVPSSYLAEKAAAAEAGLVPSSYLAEKAAATEAVRICLSIVSVSLYVILSVCMSACMSACLSARDGFLPLTSLRKQPLLRRYVLKELAETEQEYVNELKTLTDAIKNHVTSATSQPLSESVKANCDVIFSNVAEIYNFHEKDFLDCIRECIANPASVGDTFLNKKAELEMYGEFWGERQAAAFLLETEETKTFVKVTLAATDKL
ncbi:triple functional domain protein [Elysia marginata]|uniref:Triple functional domain protein n=1 Tax=Elysia marginata TaxID=1093978 RepID=A0AAV4ETG2_9GAST|nr:triple functional domain protein [Elysia marginata]